MLGNGSYDCSRTRGAKGRGGCREGARKNGSAEHGDGGVGRFKGATVWNEDLSSNLLRFSRVEDLSGRRNGYFEAGYAKQRRALGLNLSPSKSTSLIRAHVTAPFRFCITCNVYTHQQHCSKVMKRVDTMSSHKTLPLHIFSKAGSVVSSMLPVTFGPSSPN